MPGIATDRLLQATKIGSMRDNKEIRAHKLAYTLAMQMSRRTRLGAQNRNNARTSSATK